MPQKCGNKITAVMSSTPRATMPGNPVKSVVPATKADHEVRNVDETLNVFAIPVS